MNAHTSGSVISSQYEVVVGPVENPRLQGGFGLVYFCVDHGQDDRPVALKTFRPEYLSQRRVRDAFLREATVWMDLGKHPHIVQAYQVVRVGDGREVYVVIELVPPVEGHSEPSLRSWLKAGGRLPLKQALELGLGMARGMKHVVGKVPRLVHWDLKPENVLVGRDGQVRVTDFGLAVVLGEAAEEAGEVEVGESPAGRLWDGRSLSVRRGFAGTPAYAAPEQFGPGEVVDARADIYAFGCVLYEMVTGRVPFRVERGGRSLEELLAAYGRKHREDEVVWERGWGQGVEGLVRGCLAKRREGRYGSWGEVEAALAEGYRQEVGVEAPAEETGGEEATRAERVGDGWSYGEIGCSYLDLGKAAVAARYFERALGVGRREGERLLEGAGLNHLGLAYATLGDARWAIGCYEQALAIDREIGDRSGEGASLGNLGNAYAALGDARRAIGCYEQVLAIAREIGDRGVEGNAVGNLGNAYAALGDARRAIGCYEQALAIAREIGDRAGEAIGRFNVAWLYAQQGQRDNASGHAAAALEFFQQIRHAEYAARAETLLRKL